MNINQFSIIHHIADQHLNDLHALYQKEWWCCHRTIEDVHKIITNTSILFAVVYEKTGQLIGFSRVLTDYFRFAYIYDVIIHEDFRGQDLGKFLIQTVVDHPQIKDLHSIELVCRKDKISFYEQFDFSQDYALSVAMRRLKINS